MIGISTTRKRKLNCSPQPPEFGRFHPHLCPWAGIRHFQKRNLLMATSSCLWVLRTAIDNAYQLLIPNFCWSNLVVKSPDLIPVVRSCWSTCWILYGSLWDMTDIFSPNFCPFPGGKEERNLYRSKEPPRGSSPGSESGRGPAWGSRGADEGWSRYRSGRYHMINGNFRILKWRYVSTIFLAIFCWDIPLHRPEQ